MDRSLPDLKRLAAPVVIGLAPLFANLVGAQDLPRPTPIMTSPAKTGPLTLEGLIQLGLAQHPKLTQAGFAVEAARGKALQAGLYPNPTVAVTLDELGDRTGPQGVNTLPLVSQEIVTKGKLKLDRAAANREVDQATLALLNQRFQLLAGIRQAYFDVIAMRRRIDVLHELSKRAEQSLTRYRALVNAQQEPPHHVVLFEVELARLRVEREAAERELPAVYRRLAAAAGVPGLAGLEVIGSLDAPLPKYELDRVQAYVLSVHPDVRSAQVGVDRARLVLRRAEVEPFPNVTVGAGYVRQNQNRSDDWTLGVSVPVPAWNRNQGNIRAVQAAVAQATQEIARIEIELVEKVAAGVRDYAAARQRVELLGGLPGKTEQYREKVRDAPFRTPLELLEAQRQNAQIELEYVRALGDAWKAASVISGLTLEEQWPPAQP